MIIPFFMKSSDPKIVVAANLKADIPGLLTQTDVVVAGIEGHTNYFPNYADLLGLKTSRTALGTLYASGANIKGGTKQRNPAERDLRNRLLGAARYVETCANNDPVNGPAIVIAGGFTEKKKSPRGKAALSLYFRGASGTIEAEAKAAKGKVFYHWRASVDGGATWPLTSETNVSATSFSGLTVGTTVLVQVATTQKNVRSPWSSSASILAR